MGEGRELSIGRLQFSAAFRLNVFATVTLRKIKTLRRTLNLILTPRPVLYSEGGEALCVRTKSAREEAISLVAVLL